jgi:hypothetical protein
MFGTCLVASVLAGVVPAAADSSVAVQAPENHHDKSRHENASRATKNALSKREIEKRLMKPVTLQFADCPLRQIAADLSKLSGVNFVLDTEALKEASLDPEIPLTLNVEMITLKSSLNLLLHQAHLSYVIKDGLIQVTTEPPASRFAQTTYPVVDLVVPMAMHPDSDKGIEPSQTVEKSSVEFLHRTVPPDTLPEVGRKGNIAVRRSMGKKLVDLIHTTIAPDTWRERGGPGTITYRPRAMALVVCQTQDVQEQIFEMLAAIRRLQELAVAVEVQLVEVSEPTLKKLCLAQQVEAQPDCEWEKGVFLNNCQVALLLELIQADPRTSVVQAPTLTLFNGECAPIDLSERHTSVAPPGVGDETDPLQEETADIWHCKIRAIVSADRRSVLMKLDLARTVAALLKGKGTFRGFSMPDAVRLQRTQTLAVEQSLRVPAGKTAVLYVGQRLGRPGSDTIGKSAKGGRPTAGRSREIRHVLVLVKPHIIDTTAEGHAFPGLLPPLPCPR